MPNISMSLSANYKTPRLFDGNIVGKKLTDARIRFYQERGRYGPEYKQQQAKRTTRRKTSSLAVLMKEFS